MLKTNRLIILLLFLAHLAQFWPLYFQHLLPFPGDMLVAFHFPWSGGGFAGFDPWTQFKALNTVDVIKQFYPWKVFAFDFLRHWQWPLWNPYSFSGMPFIANLQSGIFFPLNLVYFFVPVLWSWVFNVAGQLLLFGGFFYLFLRSQKLSKTAAVFGAVVAMNLSYIILWHWQLVITESLLFLPLILYFINRYFQSKKLIYLLFVPVFLAFSFFGGHAQTVTYVYFIFWFFALYRRIPLKLILLISIFPIFLAAVQLLPSVEAYLLSAREGAATKDLFAPFIFHWKNIVTVLAPDFFGHPSSRNYSGTDYRDMNAYFGITAFIFSLLSFNQIRKNHDVKFFFFLTIFGLLFAAWPLAFIFDIFNIPVLSSGVPARMIFIFQFGGAVLSAYGLESWLQDKNRHKLVILVIGLTLLFLWLIGNNISRNNLIIPTAFFAATSVFILIKSFRRFLVAGIFILLFFQYSYFFHKYNSFSPEKFVFPTHPILARLQKYSGIDRFFGTEQAILNYNFSVFYKLFDFEGYDSMYPKRYGQLIASAETGTVPQIIPRSDAYLKHWSDRQSERLLDLLGAKYLLDKNDLLTGEWDEEPSRFNPDRYQLIWERRPWRIYERKTTLSRIALFGNYDLETNAQKIISKLYDINFDYQNKLILEENPKIFPVSTTNKTVQLISYEANKIVIKEKADQPQLLWLSDNFYPGWKVLVDGQEQKILRANFTFRAVSLDKGEHLVIFEYDPLTFKLGLIVSLISFGSLGILILCVKKS